jgi:hypothetical protein
MGQRRWVLPAFGVVVTSAGLYAILAPRDDLAALKPFVVKDEVAYQGYQLGSSGGRSPFMQRHIELNGVSKRALIAAVSRFVSKQPNWGASDMGDWYVAGPKGFLETMPGWGPQLEAARQSGDNDNGHWRLNIEANMSTMDVWRQRIKDLDIKESHPRRSGP